MRITATTNVDDVVKAMGAWIADLNQKVMPAALNELADRVEVAGIRTVAKVYGLTQRDFRKYLRRNRARPGDTKTDLIAAGRALPMALFNPKQTSRGVTVRIKGRRILVPHAFIARMPNGYVGVFARGAYGGKGLVGVGLTGETFGRFVFAKGRKRRVGNNRRSSSLPINQLMTFGPAEAWGNEITTDAMLDKAEADLGKVFRQSVRRFAR